MLAFSSSMVLHGVLLLSLSLNCTPCMLIKGIEIWELDGQMLRGDVVAEIFFPNTGFFCLCGRVQSPVESEVM